VGVWIAVVAVLLVLAVTAGLVVMRLRSVQAAVEDSWQQVLLALRRRRGLSVELAEAVRVGSGGAVDLVDDLRDASEVADLPGASPGQQVTAERDLETALTKLSAAMAESPELVADAHVAAVRAQLDDADRRVHARRDAYERSERVFRRRVGSFPGRWVARALGIRVPSEGDE
jgi:LemA protein